MNCKSSVFKGKNVHVCVFLWLNYGLAEIFWRMGKVKKNIHIKVLRKNGHLGFERPCAFKKIIPIKKLPQASRYLFLRRNFSAGRARKLRVLSRW